MPTPVSVKPAVTTSPVIDLTPKPAPVILAQDRKEPIKGIKKAMVKSMTAAMVNIVLILFPIMHLETLLFTENSSFWIL